MAYPVSGGGSIPIEFFKQWAAKDTTFELRKKHAFIHQYDSIPDSDEIKEKAVPIRGYLAYQKCGGDYSDALQLAQELTQEAPQWSRSWIALGDTLWKRAQKHDSVDKDVLREAKIAYRKAYRICPGDPDILKGLGKVAYCEEKYVEALKFFEQAKQQICWEEEPGKTERDGTLPASYWISKCEPYTQPPPTVHVATIGWIKG